MKDMIQETDSILEELLQKWNVTGMSVALVKDGEVLCAKGYGLRNRETGAPMTERTVMPIGSVTKTFTALALGMLVDEGKLDWDKPVREYIPWLKLWDPVTTQRVTPGTCSATAQACLAMTSRRLSVAWMSGRPRWKPSSISNPTPISGQRSSTPTKWSRWQDTCWRYSPGRAGRAL